MLAVRSVGFSFCEKQSVLYKRFYIKYMFIFSLTTRVSHAMLLLANAYLLLEQQFFKFIRKGVGNWQKNGFFKNTS